MNINELKEYLKPLARYKLVLNVTDVEDGEKKIEAIDEDIYEFMGKGGEIEKADYSVPIGSFYTHILDGKHFIGYIEHNYKDFTSANYKDVIYICDLINKEIEFE